jgi:DNA-binding GntR family transcriptional regulator
MAPDSTHWTPMTGDARRRRSRPTGSATLTDRAYQLLEEAITTLELAPGALVSEATLSDELGIGRTPIREALQRLARERLINILPKRGVVVTEIDAITQLRVLEVRRELERFIARAAARRATPQQRTELRELAQQLEDAAGRDDDIAFMRADRDFNRLLLAAARNQFAAGSMALMNGLSRRFWFAHYKRAADMPRAARLHADVAREAAEGNEDLAAAAAGRLIDYLEEVARATVSADS